MCILSLCNSRFLCYTCFSQWGNKRRLKIIPKVDKRRHYILVVDTETANTIQLADKVDMSNVLVYDCGWQVVDTKGNVYTSASYVNSDVFVHERELMHSAYYAKKIPQYVTDIRAGRRKMATLYEIRQAMLSDIKKYGIKEVAAHNARFDFNALNGTQRYITKSKYRYFFPYDIVMWDTMKMAQSVICKMPTYIKFCEKYGYFTDSKKPRKTAEILWRFISKNPDFVESHTGLEDVTIEAQIMAYCFRQHKHLEKELFPSVEEREPPTAFQRTIMASLRENPTIKI